MMNLLAIIAAASLSLPVFTPSGGTYAASENTDARVVQVGLVDPGICVAYTVDGNKPTREKCQPFGALVTLPLGRTVLKAIQCDATRCSSVRSNTYTITQRAATVVHSPVVKLYWRNPAPDDRIGGYVVRYGPGSNLKESKNVEAAEATITIDAPGIWSFVVTACDRSGKESPNVSNHIRVNYQP